MPATAPGHELSWKAQYFSPGLNIYHLDQTVSEG